MDVSGETTRLREEVRYLRRRLQYMQSISTVFRQRISLLLREVAEDPSRVRDLHAAYTALLSETALAEKQDSFDPRFDSSTSAAGGGGGGGSSSPSSQGFGSPSGAAGISPQQRQDPIRAREDVRRAHHLCVILQERNDLKKRELELEHVNRELLQRIDDFERQNAGILGGSGAKLTSSYNPSNNTNTNNQQNQQRRGNNQSGLMNTPRSVAAAGTTESDSYEQQQKGTTRVFQASGLGGTNSAFYGHEAHQQHEDPNNNNNQHHHHGHGRSGSADTQSTTSSSIPGAAMLRSLGGGSVSEHNHNNQLAVVALQRQNSFLKNRVQKMKQDLDESLRSRQDSIEDLQRSIDQLVGTTQSLKTDVARSERQVAEANRAKLEAQKELLFQKSREELLLAKLSANPNSSSSNSSSGGGQYGSESNQMIQALSQQLQDRDQTIREQEDRAMDLEDHLRESEAKRASKDVEIAALGAQIKGLHARLDTFDAERSSSTAQASLVADVHERLLSAVADIQQGANSDSLARTIGDVSGKLDKLEALELQLRQKEDMLALADDEVARSHTTQQQLKEALAAFSPLFLQLPKSADALERLVIERDELLSEIRRATQEGRTPDLNAVEGRVELRSLQTNTQRSGSTSAAASGGGGGMPMVPPLPPLVDIRAEAHGKNNYINDYDSEQRSSGRRGNYSPGNNNNNSRSSPNNHHRPILDAIPITHLTPNDVSATFRLFAPPNSGPETSLSGEPLKLCFAALGLPSPGRSNQNNNNNVSMTESQLVAHVAQKQAG